MLKAEKYVNALQVVSEFAYEIIIRPLPEKGPTTPVKKGEGGGGITLVNSTARKAFALKYEDINADDSNEWTWGKKYHWKQSQMRLIM